MAQNATQAEYSEQNILNQVYEKALKAFIVSNVGYNGVTSQLNSPDAMATKITTSGSITYIGIAAPGTVQATAKWQCHKVNETDPNNVVITWADSGNFSQVATDLTALTYS